MARHKHKNPRVKVYFRYKGRCFRLLEAINFGTKEMPELKIKGLAETYMQTKDDQKADYLMKNVIQECLDVMPMIYNLPDVLLSQIKKNLGIMGNVDIDSLNSEKKNSLKKQVASILYSTRNSIVHAKANYTPNGWECPKECLKDINEVMDSYALKLIAWNETQPEWIKV